MRGVRGRGQREGEVARRLRRRLSGCQEICACESKAEGGTVFRGDGEMWGNVEMF